MDCQRARLLVSAALDNEMGVGEEPALRQHLAGCPACRAYADDADALHRVVRITPAAPVPDLTASILAATAEAAAPTTGTTARRLRLALVTIAVVQILIALPMFFSPSDHTAHLSAFDLALAVGFLWVAARPTQSLAGFLPIGTALVLLCLGLAVLDATHGDGQSVWVVTHSFAVLGMIVAWALEAQTHRRHGDAFLAA